MFYYHLLNMFVVFCDIFQKHNNIIKVDCNKFVDVFSEHMYYVSHELYRCNNLFKFVKNAVFQIFSDFIYGL